MDKAKAEQKTNVWVYQCDERLKTQDEGSTRLAYTGLLGGLEHLKIKTSLIDKKFASVMVECVITWFTCAGWVFVKLIILLFIINR